MERPPRTFARQPASMSIGSSQPSGLPGQEFTEVFGSVRQARAAIRNLTLGPDLEERAALVVTELATNAILHAGGLLYVRLWYGGGHLRMEVADASRTMPEPAAPGNMSGRGLLIVGALANAWGAEARPNGKVVWADLH